MPDRDPRAPLLYRALLCLFPRGFRERWGPDMESVFRHRLEATGRGPGWIAVWVRGIFDLVLGAAREWTSRMREGMGRGMTGGLGRDFRHAVRALRRSPGVALLAILTLGLGIGANTTTFSVVDAVMFRPLPYDDPGRIVAVWPEANSNAALVREFDEGTPALSTVAGITSWSAVLTGAGDPLEISLGRVTPSYFGILGVPPMLGRMFDAADALPGNEAIVVLGHDLWRSRFGSDPDIVGRTIQLSVDQTTAHTVVGVMPSEFYGIPDLEAWAPLPLDPGLTSGEDDSWFVNWRIARLAPGATVDQASEQVATLARRYRVELPNMFDDAQVAVAGVVPIKEELLEESSMALWIMLSAVGLVLLIACANVANLLLVRGEARSRDLAVRSALGAGRGSIVRLMLVESLILGLVGGVLGVVTAVALLDVIVALAPSNLPRLDQVTIDGRVLGFALTLTVLATLVSGLWPALRSSRTDVNTQLGGSARSSVGRRGSRRMSDLLVTGEIALAVVVTLGSVLMLRSLDRLLSEDPGYDPYGVVTFHANPLGELHSGAEDYRAFYEAVLEGVRAAPGVQSAGTIHLLTGTSGRWSFPTWVQGVEIVPEDGPPNVSFRAVLPGFFETLRIPLLQGRLLNDADRPDTEKVMMVNRAFVQEFWPGEDPIGRTVSLFGPDDPHRVVGVVGDVRQFGLDRAPEPEMYYSTLQWPWEVSAWVVARTDRPELLKSEIRSLVDAVDPNAPVSGIDDLDRVMGRSAAQERFLAVLLSAFGLLGLTLGAIGVYGVTAYTVARRAPEFGVRIALGASRGDVVQSALRLGLRPVVLGLVAGLVAGLAGSRLLQSYLYQVQPTDPLAVVGAVAALGTVALLALTIPARRAGRVDPMEVLSSE